MKQYLQTIIKKEDLTQDEAFSAMDYIARGEAGEAETAAFLVALAMKGETVDEVIGMVRAMREHMISIDVGYDTLDTCGTGGDGTQMINVSTISAFVCAATGAKVAKHGNRSVSSKCGSFDVLEKLGVRIDLDKDQIKKCLNEIGIACIFAPNFHPAMKHVVPIRKALGIRTVFNFMGPLLNPAHATHQLVGVSSREMAKKLGSILISLGSKRVILVNSDDGLDEISIAAPTQVYEFIQGEEMKAYTVEPEKKFALAEVRGGEAEENAIVMKNILNENGSEAQNEFVAMNAGMALCAAGMAESFEDAKKRAREILKSGEGIKKLKELVEFSKSL